MTTVRVDNNPWSIKKNPDIYRSSFPYPVENINKNK